MDQANISSSNGSTAINAQAGDINVRTNSNVSGVKGLTLTAKNAVNVTNSNLGAANGTVSAQSKTGNKVKLTNTKIQSSRNNRTVNTTASGVWYF